MREANVLCVRTYMEGGDTEGAWAGRRDVDDCQAQRGVYRSNYKGHKDKIKGEGKGGGERWDWLEWGGGMGRKCRQL